MINRRTLLKTLASIALFPAQVTAQNASREDRDELIRFLIQESDRLGVPALVAVEYSASLSSLSEAAAGTTGDPLNYETDFQIFSEIINDVLDKKRLWWDEPLRDPPAWAAIEESNDYAHLSGYARPSSSFAFSASDFRFLLQRNDFAIPQSQRKVLFGLRGCLLAQPDDPGEAAGLTGWASAHELEWTFPNHMQPRCVLGVWDRDSMQLRLFRGSTVPEVSYMFLYIYKIAGCNLLPTGQYRYAVGTHRPTSANPQHGAFRQAERVVVLRTPNDLTYNSGDRFEGWQLGEPGDNIHAAHFYQRVGPPYYSSAGCQVILGTHRSRTVGGPWGGFREAAGLAATPNVSDDGRGFRYVLLTGLEAALAANRTDEFVDTYRRIRFGSSGPRAGELQRQMGVMEDQDFRAESVLELIRNQKAVGDFESGIYVDPPA